MSGSEEPSHSSDLHYPPGSFHDRFSLTSESRPPTPVNVNARIIPAFEQKTRRKVDSRLIPVLATLYAIAFIDATNLAIVRREGMDSEFHLFHGHRDYFLTFVFFLPFLLLPLPLVLAFRRVGATLWLGTTVFLLGALQIASAFVNDWGEFLGARLILGILEAGILPSCVYMISCWYTRSELQIRLTLFYSASVFCGSFGNVFALGLSKVHTKTLSGWRWILALEGLLTLLLSFYGYSAIMPFPDKKHTAHEPLLSRDEIHLMRQRIEIDRHDYVPDTLDKVKLYKYLTDMNLWSYAFLALCVNMAIYSSPVLLQSSLPSDNLSNVEQQLLSIPIGLVATAMALATGFVSSRIGVRGPFLVFNFLISTTGLSMSGFSNHKGVKFAGCFLTYLGAQANLPIILSLQAMNVRQHSKRIFTVSLVASFGGAGALLSALAFPDSSAPNFTQGLGTTLALQATGAIIAVILSIRLSHLNKMLRAQRDEERVCGTNAESDRVNRTNQRANVVGSGSLDRREVIRREAVEGTYGFQYFI